MEKTTKVYILIIVALLVVLLISAINMSKVFNSIDHSVIEESNSTPEVVINETIDVPEVILEETEILLNITNENGTGN